MSYTLRNTTFTNKLLAVFAVDDDGQIKCWRTPGAGPDHSNGSGIQVCSTVTTGTGTFGGAGSRTYFQTQETDSTFHKGAGVVMTLDYIDGASGTSEAPVWFGRPGATGVGVIAVMNGATGHGGTLTGNAILCQMQRSSTSTTYVQEGAKIDSVDTVPNPDEATIGFYTTNIAREGTDSKFAIDGSEAFTVGVQYLYTGTQNGIGAGAQTWFGYAGSAGAFEPSSPTVSTTLPNEHLYLTGIGGGYSVRQAITAATAANPIQFTIAGTSTGLTNSDYVIPFGFTGDWAALNGVPCVVANYATATDTTFTIGQDGSGWESYGGGGYIREATPNNSAFKAQFYCWCAIGELATDTEYSTLHSDWFGTLFESGTSVAPLAGHYPTKFFVNDTIVQY